jgi:hypothetical protein
VQAFLGRRQLEHLLGRVGLLEEGQGLAQAYPEVGRGGPGSRGDGSG